MTNAQERALEMIRAQQKKAGEGSTVWCAGEQLADITMAEPESAELLARDVAARLELEPVDALRAVRAVRQQARLDSDQRMENLRGVIEAHADLTGRRVLLIDDVRTTGATAHTCADALRKAGAERVYLLCYCVAKGEK